MTTSRRLLLLLLPLILLGCGTGPTPTPSPTPSPTPEPQGLYLRAWLEQAIPPQHTFGWLPMVTIDEGRLIDGLVAVPAIYPGPLMVLPNVRGISPAGQAALLEQARQLGLLGERTDFSGGGLMPGGQSAHLEIVVDGVRRELVGDPAAPPGDQPGTPGAFALFWQRLATLNEWLAPELGPTTTYQPQRVALVTLAPQPAEVEPDRVAWPLDQTLAELGGPWVVDDARCATVEGDNLELLLPVLRQATQITIFVDATDAERSLLVRPLVPGEPSPCEAEA